ncbi:hypothetical protein OG782_04145 [Streptomyces sp. NBC_00876]|uniref:hypothetical protein n=1 Tax=Streptomyces sp. NBC_00876 TaxID=2975853 RepID=UPI003863C440|nr:hypothetical protein OG782_04145 [Streptomyces sp. NBC_00876]
MLSALKVTALPKDRKAGDVILPGVAEGFRHVVTDESAGPFHVIAYLERELPPGGIPAYLAARKTGARSFVMWDGPERRARLATVVTTSAGEGVSVYQVWGGQGELVGTLVREKALSGKGLRTRWTVSQTGCPEAVGFKGRIFWWYVWWLLFPVQVAIGVGSLLSGSGDVARGPRRIIWRAGGEVPLEFRSDEDEVQVHAQWVDRRLAAALSALIRTFDSWMGTPWDDGK